MVFVSGCHANAVVVLSSGGKTKTIHEISFPSGSWPEIFQEWKT